MSDFEFELNPEHTALTSMAIDEATDLIFDRLRWPKMGGPSGRGWSYFSVAQRCGRLFRETYDREKRDESLRQTINGSGVPFPLQVGGLFHTLHALYEAPAIDGCGWLPDRQGLITRKAGAPLDRRISAWAVPSDAVETFLAELKAMAGLPHVGRKAKLPPLTDERKPSTAVILEAERLFDAHALHWSGKSDVEPLAVELYARATSLHYTCRYDMVGRVGSEDPLLDPGVYIFERKTTKYIDEAYLASWTMDGEILGQIMCWKESGLDDVFGPLAGVVMDVVSKSKVPACKRVVIPPTVPHVDRHRRWLKISDAQIRQWQATELYPQSFGNCYGRYGICGNWERCVTEAP